MSIAAHLFARGLTFHALESKTKPLLKGLACNGVSKKSFMEKKHTCCPTRFSVMLCVASFSVLIKTDNHTHNQHALPCE